MSDLTKPHMVLIRYLPSRRDRLPTFSTDHVNLEALLEEGRRLREEQVAVARMRLSSEYMKSTGKIRQSMIGLSG